MKASIKFREEQNPLVRAKIPLNILGFPFQSGVVAGDSNELGLNLATFFESGPSLKIAYRPNDSVNPFSLVFKTGSGHFGSPIASPITMSAEFNLIGSRNPSFFVHFRPQFGDFSLKRSQSSDFATCVRQRSNGPCSASDDESIEVVETPPIQGGYGKGVLTGTKVRAVLSPEPPHAAARLIEGFLRGTEALARTSLPLVNGAALKFRWGFRFPAAVAVGKVPSWNLPALVMNKISVEHVADDRSKESGTTETRVVSQGDDVDVAWTCLAVKRQLEMIQSENGVLRKALDDLRHELAGEKCQFPATAGGEKRSQDVEGFGGKLKKDGNEKKEFKK